MTAPVHPGGWVDGIGWVALGSSLGPSDLFARWQGDPPRPKHPYRMCDRTPVIVTCWADGTVPTWVPSHPDSIQFRLRQFTPHHPVASGRQAMMDAADALDVTHCADGSTPQAPTVDSVAVPRADGAGLIAAERQRQIDAEGWTPEHDDTHTIGELVDAAVCYLRHGLDAEMAVVWPWPWTEDWWKPSDDPIKNLVRAGALIAAEIDRLTRAAAGVSSDR